MADEIEYDMEITEVGGDGILDPGETYHITGKCPGEVNACMFECPECHTKYAAQDPGNADEVHGQCICKKTF